jgi:hypothetical protein
LSQKGAQIEKTRRNMWKCREGEDERESWKKMNTSEKKREKEN